MVKCSHTLTLNIGQDQLCADCFKKGIEWVQKNQEIADEYDARFGS